jgi:large subunit ribosomal protein L13
VSVNGREYMHDFRTAATKLAHCAHETHGRPSGYHGRPPRGLPRGRFRAHDQHPLLKTYVATPQDRERNWLLVDAEGQTLGRLATQIADALRGKRKPTYTPHVDTGDFVVVVNAEKISVTGAKRHEKLYHRHSGYPGGLKTRTLNDMLERRPEEVIRLAVRGMLPKNRLARKQLTKLKVYAGPDHPHEAQKPQPMEIQS